MPRRARSGVPNLYKKHSSGCRNRDPLKCDCTRKFRIRLDESVEDRLFAACDRLDEMKPPPWSRLDWDKVDEIRTRAAASESQQQLAAAFGISVPLCCQVIKERVWTEARRLESAVRQAGADGGRSSSHVRLRASPAVLVFPVSDGRRIRVGRRQGESQPEEARRIVR
jgi:hypothetical protein